MSNQQPKSAPKKQAPPKSKTSSTASKKPVPKFDQAKAVEIMERLAALVEKKEKALAPLEEFHAAVESAEDEDVRLYWDVRIVSGKDTPIKSLQGTSTMPGLLTEKMLPNAPSMIQQDIIDKIALPLTGVFMKEGEIRNPIAKRLEVVDADEDDYPDYAADEEESTSGGDKLASIVGQGSNVREAEIVEAEEEEDKDPDDDTGEAESSERKEEERDDV